MVGQIEVADILNLVALMVCASDSLDLSVLNHSTSSTS